MLSSSDPRLVGKRIDLGDSRVREGRGWVGDVDDDGHEAVAGHAPILNDDGELVGLSIAQQRYPSSWERFTNAAPDLALFLGVGALLGVAGSLLLARLIKRRTRGLEPHEIATLADHREALLHSIREGVIAVGHRRQGDDGQRRRARAARPQARRRGPAGFRAGPRPTGHASC